MNKLQMLAPMKLLQAVAKPGVLQQNSVRTAFVITKDWLPGKRPETEEERLKAAKKYNMLPEEYEPQPDDGLACGDYPHIPGTHHDAKDPFYPYDYPFFRTNYGEPLPDSFAVSMSVQYNYQNEFDKHVSLTEQFLTLTAVLGGFGLLVWFYGIKYRHYDPHFSPAKFEKGVTHYGYPSK